MIKDVMNALMHDKIRTFFCWITFTLTSMFIFLFFAVAMSDAVGVTMIQAKSDVPTILMVAAVLLCSIEIVFTNDFFIKNKAKNLAIRLICGATYTQNAGYLLLQTVFILCLALPTGIILGLCAIPLINVILISVMHTDITVTLSFQSILWSILVLSYVIFWTLLLNLSFSYRNSAAQLLNPNAIKMPQSQVFSLSNAATKYVMKVLHLILWIAPLLLFYYDKSLVLVCTIASLAGYAMVLTDFFLPLLDTYIHQKIDQKNTLIALGLFRNDLKVLKINILLFIIASTLLISLLTSTENPIYQMLVLITYISMNCLLALTIMFKYANEMSDRIIKFKTLSHIGYLQSDIKKIIRKEVFALYTFITISILIYLINIFATLYLGGMLEMNHIWILIVGSITPIVLCGLISLLFYRRTVIKGE